MKHRRLICSILVCVLLTALLSGCGRTKAKETETAPAAQSAEAAPIASPDDPMHYDRQRERLEQLRELWAFTDPWDSPWFYTFTDLDHNGRIEVIAATTQGTGIYTYGRLLEVTEDGGSAVNVYRGGAEIEGPDDWPELIRDSLPCYYDEANDRYYYACEGVTRDGAARYYNAWYALSLKDGYAVWELLADKETVYEDAENEEPTVSCRDAAGNPITEQEYDSAVEDRFEGMLRTELALDWTQVEIPFDNGEQEPAEEPAAAETPALMPEPAGANDPHFAISKNPTSEALAIGGKTWFIAHADNGVAPVWLMQDPDGQLYSLGDAMAAHPGLQLEVLPQDTIAVSNVPLSVNGWGVVARFDGDGGSLYTEPAYLYVGDFVTAYGSVIEKYRAAYSGGSRDIGYAYEHGISEIIGYSEHVGYALKDLDKDGTPELIIAGMGTDDFSDKMVYDLYTLAGAQPAQLACSAARNRWYLRSDSLLINEGSSGAAYSNVFLFAVKGGGLEAKEGVIVYDGSCYYQNGSCDYEPRSGDRSITMDEYTATWDRWKSACYLPQLTRIA